jgi:hypothetical protein
MTNGRTRPAALHAAALTRGALAALAILSSGCSVLFVKRAPSSVEDPTAPVSCTRPPVAPILDTAVVAAGLVTAIDVASWESCSDPYASVACINQKDKDRTVAIAGGIAAAYALSAIVGYSQTSTCRRTVNLNRRCIGGDIAACQALQPGWVPRSGPASWGVPPSAPPPSPGRPPPGAPPDPWGAPPGGSPPPGGTQ